MEELANAEIDALIAREVMKWELVHVGYYGTDDESPRQVELEAWLDAQGVESVGDYWVSVAAPMCLPIGEWRPSTDMTQAWKALKQFNWQRKFNVELSTWQGDWRCVLTLRYPRGNVYAYVSAHVYPERALCQAMIVASRGIRES